MAYKFTIKGIRRFNEEKVVENLLRHAAVRQCGIWILCISGGERGGEGEI